MDKRTLIFVLALTLALFGVNIYFEQQHQEKLKEWSSKHQSKLAEGKDKIEAEIAENTVSANKLPLVDIYSDEKGEDFLSTGVQIDQIILSVALQDLVFEQVYVRKHGSEDPLEAVSIDFLPQDKEQPIVYQKGQTKTIAFEGVPHFGTYYVQLVEPAKDAQSPARIILGKYVDGHFTIPELQLQGKDAGSLFPHNALAILQDKQQMIPIGYYDSSKKKIVTLNQIEGMKSLLAPIEKKPVAKSSNGKKSEELFYVLESPYQQLVFSNYGGALAEINLPFQSTKDSQSVVKQIEWDREMVEKHPYNAYFPAHPYYTSDKNQADSFKEHSEGSLGGYYPLIRRDLIQTGNRKSIRVTPQYYALNVISEYPEVAEQVYEVKHFDSNSIVFEAATPHRRITKTYSLANDGKSAPYTFNLSIKIEGDSRGLWISSGVPEVEWISGSPAPALKYRITRNEKSNVENIDLPQDAMTVTSVYPDWICNSNGFLGLILDPLSKIDPGYRVQQVPGTVVPSRLTEIGQEYDMHKPQQMPGYMTLLPLKSNGGVMDFRVYAGPFAGGVLSSVDQIYSDPATGYNPDYIACQTFHGWFSFISEPFAKFLLILMKFFHSVTGSWALSIVLLTVALRIMMYPLNAWSTKSMIRMQQVAPEIAAIQERNKKDPKKAQIEIMNVYREKGVNPISGCLPLLIQMPFLIGMFDLLKSTFELRGASFIPGWIDDLAAPDVLFSWKTPIFFIGTQFHLLPILLGVVMFLQQRMMSTLPKDQSLWTDQQRQQRSMGTIMSVLFAVMFYNFPSGLNIYWLSSMLLGILQQWWTTKQLQKQKPKAVVK